MTNRLNRNTRSGAVGLVVKEPVCLLNWHVMHASGKCVVSGELCKVNSDNWKGLMQVSHSKMEGGDGQVKIPAYYVSEPLSRQCSLMLTLRAFLERKK
jgi:hypothetical protein